MRFGNRLCVTLFLLTPFAQVGSASAYAQNTSAAGGTSGTSYSFKCADGMVLTSISASSGQWIDVVWGECREPNITNGSWQYTSYGAPKVGPAGGSSSLLNQSKNASCDPGYAVKEFSGGAGSYVHTIKVTCYKLGASVRTGTTTQNAGTVGSSGGNSYGPHKCPESKPAIGIYGKEGMYVDRFGLICGYIMPSTPVLVSPGAGRDVTSRRPTFDWDDARFVTKAYKICINQSAGAACSQSGTISGTVNLGTTQWTPSADLTYARGDIVYWRVEACNDSGCTGKSSSFRFMP